MTVLGPGAMRRAYRSATRLSPPRPRRCVLAFAGSSEAWQLPLLQAKTLPQSGLIEDDLLDETDGVANRLDGQRGLFVHIDVKLLFKRSYQLNALH